MADSFNKKDREKKRRKKKQDKAEKKKQRKLEGKAQEEFMYVDENGNLTSTPPDPSKKREVDVASIDIGVPRKGEKEEKDFTRTGVVKFFNEEKGYGFIIDTETQESYFVHIENIHQPIDSRDNVEFDIGSGPKGPVALNVKLVN